MFKPRNLFLEALRVEYIVVESFQRLPNKAVYGTFDTGINFMAEASSKMAEMLRTLCDSGKQDYTQLLKGELGDSGGLCHDFGSIVLLVFFASGSEECDVEIAQAGKDAAIEDWGSDLNQWRRSSPAFRRLAELLQETKR
jgi:hypothetical protein